MSRTHPDHGGDRGADLLQASAMQAASPIVLALEECDEDLRGEAIELFGQLMSGELDDDERFATVSLLTEILFPSRDVQGTGRLDREEAETFGHDGASAEVSLRMEREAADFAERLRLLMSSKQITQEVLAKAIGVGQSAISMMLQRNCRPQKRTVMKIAKARGVAPEELWPSLGTG